MAANGDDVKRELKRLEEKVDELAKSSKIGFEHVHDGIQKLGEGYDAGLKAISRQIQALDKKWTGRFATHDLALKNHAGRIAAIERRENADRREP